MTRARTFPNAPSDWPYPPADSLHLAIAAVTAIGGTFERVEPSVGRVNAGLIEVVFSGVTYEQVDAVTRCVRFDVWDDTDGTAGITTVLPSYSTL